MIRKVRPLATWGGLLALNLSLLIMSRRLGHLRIVSWDIFSLVVGVCAFPGASVWSVLSFATRNPVTSWSSSTRLLVVLGSRFCACHVFFGEGVDDSQN